MILLSACGLVSVTPATTEDPDDEPVATTAAKTEEIITQSPAKTYTVSVAAGDHFTVDEASKTVVEGESVTFTLTPESGYLLDPSVGNYDRENGILTFEDVRENVTVTVSAQLASEATFTVSVTGEGFTATPAEQTVRYGEDAVFEITLTKSTNRVADVTEGVYDENAKTLTVPAVDHTTTVVLTVGTKAKCYFQFEETGLSPLPGVTTLTLRDGSTGRNGTTYYNNTYLTLTAEPTDAIYFAGWSLSKPLSEGG